MASAGSQVRRQELDRARWRNFAAIFLLYLAYPVADLVTSHAALVKLAGALLLVAFVWLYLVRLPGGRRAGVVRDWSWRAAIDMVAVEVAYCLVVGRYGLALGTFVAVALVVSMPRRLSLPLVIALSSITVFLPQFVGAWGMHGEQWALGGPILLVATGMYGVRAKFAGDVLLDQAEAEIAHLAAEQERLRIARDLHDLLGHSLTTISVKAELASRLVTLDPARAAREMAEVATLAREGLTDVRATVGGYRSVSLVTELAAAREVLAAAGIASELPPSTEVVPGELRELFGWVVREGVTNAVRHSSAARVRVIVGDRSIEVSDDGVGCPGATVGGNGLVGLRERVASVGGQVLAAGDGSGFRLRVTVPA